MPRALAALAALALLAPEASAQLSGIYTVGGTSPDYTTLGDAFADLEASGVSGAVELRVRYGTYSGPFALGPVAGVSATNRVTIRGLADAGTGDLPTLWANPPTAPDWVFQVDADYVTLEALTVRITNPYQANGNVLLVTGDAAEIRDCTIESVAASYATSGARGIRITGSGSLVVGNDVSGGSGGIDIGAAASGENTRVRLNTVTADSLGIRVANQVDAGAGGLVMRSNTVTASLLAHGFRGLLVRGVSGSAEVARNQVVARSGIGIEVVNALGSPAARVDVVNNMASVIQGAEPALRLEGSTSVDIAHNSLYAFDPISAALEVASGSGLRIQNNIFLGFNGFTTDIAAPSAIEVLDHNVHSDASGGNGFSARWNGFPQTTLAAWQAASGATSSFVLDVTFVSTGTADLHVAEPSLGDRDLRAPPLATVTTDVDGEPRDAVYPYYGADEGSEPLADPAPLDGIYLIRADGLGDYVSFDDALNDLVYGGVSGPVQFSIVIGTYTEQVTIPPITGVSATNTILFLGVPSGTSLPTIRHEGTPEANWALRIESDWVTFTDHKVENTSASSVAGRAVHVVGDDVTLDGFEVLGYDAQDIPTSQTSLAAAVFLDDAARAVLTDCEIPRASVGVYAALGPSTDGPTVSGCTISEPYNHAISVAGGTGTRIEDVVVEQTSTSDVGGLAVAVLLDDPQGSYIVRRNEITFYGGDGLRIERGISSAGAASGIVANNLIAAVETGGGLQVPLTIRETVNLRVYHNTLYMSGIGAALVVDDVGGVSSGLEILNTIADGGEHAIDIGDAAALAVMDYNAFHGGSLAFVVGEVEYVTFAAYQAATGFDAHSFEIDPAYVLLPFSKGTGDLRLDPVQGGAFALAGTPLPAIPFDIDGTPRSSTYPYMGGHELTVPIVPLSGTVEVLSSGAGDYLTLLEFLDDLEHRGMDGPLTAVLEGGVTYTDALPLGPVQGKSADAPLTITGPASGPLPVFSGADAARVVLDDADHVTIRRLRVERTDTGSLVDIEASSYVAFEECELVSPYTSSAVIDAVTGTFEAPNHAITLRSSLIDGGTTGIEIGHAGLNSSVRGVVIEGTTFIGQSQGAISLIRTTGFVRGNDITAPAGASSSWVGVEVDYSFGPSPPESLRTDMVVENNVVQGGEGAGIGWIWSTADPPTLGDLRVVNNMVRMSGTGAVKGIDLSVPKNLLVAHNTVVLDSADPEAIALDVGFGGGAVGGSAYDGQSARVVNNLLDGGGGRALDVPSPANALEESGWNVLATDGPTLVEWAAEGLPSVSCPDVACYRTHNDEDRYSVEGEGIFASGALYLTGASVGDDGLAAPLLAEVPLDLDGEARPASGVYAGADEVVGAPVARPRTEVPLVGTFTIDPAGGDFMGFQEAVDGMDLLGLGGPVVFEATGGTYAGPVDMEGPYDGASALHPVTFRSAPGEMAVIERTATTDLQDHVWRIEAVSHITLDSLTIRPLGSTYARGVHVLVKEVGAQNLRADSLTFRDMVFEAPNVDTASDVSRAIYLQGTRGVFIEGSTFDEGYLFAGPYTTLNYAEDLRVTASTFSHRRVTYSLPSVTTSEIVGLHVEGNVFTRIADSGLSSSGKAISGSIRGGAVSILSNTILARDQGIKLTVPGAGTDGSDLTAVVANNQITQPAGEGSHYAMEIDWPNAIVAHNTIVATAPEAAVRIQSRATGSVDLRHNVVVSTDGPALEVDAAAVLTETSPNALWSDGAVLATWHGTDAADLAALQAASGGFAGSVEMRPAFSDEASGDLRLAGYDAALAVAPLASVLLDIDGATRTDPTLMGVSHLTIPDLAVGVRALLQGAYSTSPTADGTPDPMRTALVAAGVVPVDHPYDDAAFDGKPAECDASGVVSASVLTADIVDWVVVALRTDAAGPDLACQPALLREDGVVLGLDGTPGLAFLAMASGDYHVVVYHRTHLAAMSAAPEALSEVSTNVDLAGAGHYGGGALVVEPGLRALRAGDGDGDGSILAPDQQSIWLPVVGQAGYLPGDFDLDGSVLANDQQVFWLPNVGVQSAVPGAASLTEPTPEARASAPNR